MFDTPTNQGTAKLIPAAAIRKKSKSKIDYYLRPRSLPTKKKKKMSVPPASPIIRPVIRDTRNLSRIEVMVLAERDRQLMEEVMTTPNRFRGHPENRVVTVPLSPRSVMELLTGEIMEPRATPRRENVEVIDLTSPDRPIPPPELEENQGEGSSSSSDDESESDDDTSMNTISEDDIRIIITDVTNNPEF